MTDRGQINRRSVLDTQGGRAYLLRRYLCGSRIKDMGHEFGFSGGSPIAYRIWDFVRSMMSDKELYQYGRLCITGVPKSLLSQSLCRWCENPDHPLQPQYVFR